MAFIKDFLYSKDTFVKSKLRFVFSIISTFGFLEGLVGFFMALFLSTAGFSGWEIGILLGTSIFVSLFSNFLIGKLCDEIPTKYLSSAGIFLYIIFFIGVSFDMGFWQYLPLFVLKGLGTRLFKDSMNSFNLKKIDHDKGRGFGYLTAANSIPVAIGMVTGGLFLQSFDFQTLFRLVSCGFSILFIMSFFLSKTKIHKTELNVYFKDVLNLKTLLFLAVFSLFALHHGAEQTSYSLFLKENLFLSQLQIGLFTGLPIIFLGLSALFLGVLYDKKKIGHKLLMYFGLLTSGLGFIVFAMLKNPGLSFLFRVIHEIGDGAFAIFIFLELSNHFKKKRIGGDMGLVFTIKIIFMAIAASVFGPIGKTFGYQWPHYISGLAMLLCIPLLVIIQKDK
ncbi:MFS transporter [Nanoarchaeota archaeon]